MPRLRKNVKVVRTDTFNPTDVAAAATILNQAAKEGTLERIVGYISYSVNAGVLGPDTIDMDIVLYPEGDDGGIGAVGTATLQDRHAYQQLWGIKFQQHDEHGITVHIPIDVRGKRVLYEGDQIKLRYKNVNGNNNLYCAYYLTCFLLADYDQG